MTIPAARRREGFPGQHLFVLPPSFVLQARRHPLLRGLFLTAAGYYPEAPGHLVERPGGVPEIILIACLSGRGWAELERGRTLPVQAGEVVVILPGAAHAYGADDKMPWSIMWAHFRGSHLADFTKLVGATRTDPILKLPPGALERLRFDELYLALEAGCTLPNLLASSARLRMILIELARLRVPVNQRTGSTHEAVRQNIEWMRMHRHRKIALAGLAAQAGLSVPHYSACFKRRTGNSPMNYFQRLKIQHAAQLLALTDLRVEEIAEAVGLEDPFYFSRLFKKVMGQSPRHFRASGKNFIQSGKLRGGEASADYPIPSTARRNGQARFSR
jgi:AraC-like DNA-binding protein